MPALETILRARALAKQGHTQRQIAQVMGVNQSTIHRLIKAASNPELSELIESAQQEKPHATDEELIGVIISKVDTKHAEVTETLSEDVKTQRSIELERLDGYTLVLEEMIGNSKWEVKLRAIDMALKVHDRRAKYLGLESPFKYEGTTSTSIVVNGVNVDRLK